MGNAFLKTLGAMLPFFEGQELSFLSTNATNVIGLENARLSKKLGKAVCSPEELATFGNVIAKLACAEEEALVSEAK